MNLTERSQIFLINPNKPQLSSLSSCLSTSRPKGISLSKQLKTNNKERSNSYIKLSSKTRNTKNIEKREIKLILQSKPINIPNEIYKIEKENNNVENNQLNYLETDYCRTDKFILNKLQAAKNENKSSKKDKPKIKKTQQQKNYLFYENESKKPIYLRL